MNKLLSYIYDSYPYSYTVFSLVVPLVFIVYYIHHKKQNGLIIASFQNIPVKIVSDSKSLKLVIKELLSYNPLYLGIDCEWRPNTKRNTIQNKVSIIQIAHEKLVIIIRLNKIQNISDAFISSKLLKLLSNTNVLKCGVGVYQDKKKLFNDHNINILGCVELNDLYYKYHTHTNTESNHYFMGLKKLSKIVCNTDMIYKHKYITLSDWATDNNLTPKQISYAAEDAIVGYHICDTLIKQNIKTQNGVNNINSDIINDMCFGIMDLNKSKLCVHKCKTNNTGKRMHKHKIKKTKKSLNSYDKQNEKLYENCKILKPNGDFLSWCRKKTLNRYVNKGYAEKIDSATIKLKFEPAGFNKKPRVEVVLGFKKNECSVCGENKMKLMRYFVVPLLYRQYLPDTFNEEAWRRHDMLPLCQTCHLRSQTFNEKFKLELCEKYGVKHYRLLDQKLVKQSQLMKYIKPLINENISNHIPKGKKIILLENVAKHFNVKYEIMDDCKGNENENDLFFSDLIRINDENGGNKEFVNKMKICYEKYTQNRINIGKNASETHSKQMITAFENNVVEFIKLWRQQFVDNMKPKYLPDYWSVENTFFDLHTKKP